MPLDFGIARSIDGNPLSQDDQATVLESSTSAAAAVYRKE
jgi:hypothetical protein